MTGPDTGAGGRQSRQGGEYPASGNQHGERGADVTVTVPPADRGTTVDAREPDPAVVAELVADAVTAHPSVVRLDGGVFGTVATFLPGRRLVGVHVGRPGEPVEIAVVLHLDRPIPDVVASLRRTVRALCDGSPVDVTVSDVDVPGVPADGDDTTPDAPGRAGVRRPVGITPGATVDIGP